MQFNYLAFAVPFFVGLMILEFFVAKKKGKKFFNFTNSIANINVGIAERLLDTLITGLFFFVYDYLHRHYGIFDIKPSLLLWVALLICTDFVWYWYHRLAHEINIFWAAHVVHHQSEDFNYTVSARITVFQAVVRTGFWAILPVIGFPAEMITSVLLIHGLYPFFIHTRLVGKLGILEYIFVTPSHHRVHHASNPEYLDKNYGDVFIIWDKLFGTFKKEESEVVYGLTKPLKSNSFLWQHFHYILELSVAAKRQKGFIQKIKIIFGKPSMLDSSIRDDLEKKFHIHNNSESAGNELNRYVVFQVIITLATLFMFILFEHYLDWPLQLLFYVYYINYARELRRHTRTKEMDILSRIFKVAYPANGSDHLSPISSLAYGKFVFSAAKHLLFQPPATPIPRLGILIIAKEIALIRCSRQLS